MRLIRDKQAVAAGFLVMVYALTIGLLPMVVVLSMKMANYLYADGAITRSSYHMYAIGMILAVSVLVVHTTMSFITILQILDAKFKKQTKEDN